MKRSKTKEFGVFCVARAENMDLEHVEALSGALINVDGVVGIIEVGTIEAGMTIQGPSAAAALAEGLRLWERGLAIAGITLADTISVTGVDTDFIEQQDSRPRLPELVGVGEIADMLQLSPQRVSSLARSASFPALIADLKSGPVFAKAAVERFATTWQRKPGRPMKVKVQRGAAQPRS